MNIWILNHNAIPPSLGGLTRHYYFSKNLSAKGHVVKIFTSSMIHNTNINMINDSSPYIEKIVDGVEYTFIKNSSFTGNGIGRILNMLEFPLHMKSVCKKFEIPDVIYTSSPDLLTAFTAVKMAKRIKVPCVVELRDLWPESIVAYNGVSAQNPIMQILYKLEKWIYIHADQLIFTIEGGKQYILEKGWENDIDLSKITNINNGADIEEFENNKKIWTLDDPELNTEDYYKVVYTGSVRKANDLERIIYAAKECRDLGYEKIKFLIYGDGTYRNELEEKCRELNLDNVYFKGRVDKKYIPFILSKSNLNLLNCKATRILEYGSSQNKLFDYLASGRPILSTIKMNYSVIDRYNCGIELEDSSAKGIAKAIIGIFNMPSSDYEELCNNAKSAAKVFDYKVLSAKVLDVLEKAIESNKERQ